IDFSKAKYEEAVAQYQKSILRAFQEVEDTLVALHTHVEQTAADQRAADAARRSLELARIRYKQGLSNYLPVLEAERALLDAQTTVIQDKAARLTDIVSMYKALGGGW